VRIRRFVCVVIRSVIRIPSLAIGIF